MIDIDTGRVIDLLESRETGDVARWLKTYPNIEVVSRDGSAQYAAAITMAHPAAIQVSDRFHLLKNLTDYAKQYISRIVGASFRITADGGAGDGEYWKTPEDQKPDLPERQHNASTEKKAETVEKVRRLAAKGLPVSEIAAEAGIDAVTARKYMKEGFDPKSRQYGAEYPSKIKPYTDKINAMLNERRTFKEIEDAIRGLGYNGAASTIRMYATRRRRLMKAAAAAENQNTELIQRKWVTKLLYQPIEKIKEITEEQLERIVKEYPAIGIAYEIVRSFKEIVFAKRVDELDSWIKTASSFHIEEINSFINGISADLDAVKNAVRYEYNNGLAEGSVNKLKLIKRVMYGRCGFETLRNKTLLLEREKIVN